MKRILLAVMAASIALAGCSTSGGLNIGGSGSPIADIATFTQTDLTNAENTAVANNDTLAIPCYPALSKWLATLPGSSTSITVSGLASGFEAGRVTVNGVSAGIPDYVYQGCGPLYMKTQGQILALIAKAKAAGL